MKTTDPRDPLDRKIDELLSSQPINAPEDFVARTLKSIEADPTAKKPATMAPIIRFALPAAAAITLAFIIAGQFKRSTLETPVPIIANAKTQTAEAPAPANENPTTDLTDSEIDELFLLQEALSGFADLDTDNISSAGLLDTFDSLYSI